MHHSMPSGYLVSLYDAATDARLAEHVPMPTLPFEGMRLTPPGSVETYAVVAVQLFMYAPDSWQAQEGDPLYADVTVRPSQGVHQGRPEEKQ